MLGLSSMDRFGSVALSNTSPNPTPIEVKTTAPGKMPKTVVNTKLQKLTPDSAAKRLATKNGTAGINRNDRSTRISFFLSRWIIFSPRPSKALK